MNRVENRPFAPAGVPGLALLLLALWTWAIWSCAEHWRGNPNYSYGWTVPLLGLGFAIRRYFLWQPEAAPSVGAPLGTSFGILFAMLAGLVAFALEYARQEMWHPEIILWSICLAAIVSTLLVLRAVGGKSLARAEAFPTLFFLTAVPWPPRWEQPLTSGLMQSVASATTEILHWLGVEAQSSGGAIALRTGLVGITEACSGIRSLQAGIMFGLAIGEWFLLRAARRILLLGLAIFLALLTNLARTLTLALQAEWHGAASVDRIHDLVGNIVITSLVLAIWLAGKLLRDRSDQPDPPGIWRSHLTHAWNGIFARRSIAFVIAALGLIAGILAGKMVYARAEAAAHTQTMPRFVAQTEPSTPNRLLPVPHEVWKELKPTSGEYVRREQAGSGSGGDCFHFFWKPSVWNRFVLVHRPDICMSGIGWQQTAPPEPLDLEMEGKTVRFYSFRFQRGATRALELWGAWRNGDPVPLDYTAAQVLGSAPAPDSLKLEGKRRSATEIVACSVISNENEPAKEIAVALLRSVFQYKNDE